MSFRTKLILVYSMLIIALSGIFSGIFMQNLNKAYQEKAEANIQMMGARISQQMDELVRPMEFVSLHFIADFDVWDAINTLLSAERGSETGMSYVTRAKTALQRRLYAFSIDKNFRRVSFFDPLGDFITSAYRIKSRGEYTPGLGIEAYLQRASALKGKTMLIPAHLDPWALSDPSPVFSLLREVRGMEKPAYIEVQRSVTELENVFDIVQNPHTSVVMMTDYGEVFYTNLTDGAAGRYYAMAEESMNMGAFSLQDPDTREALLCAAHGSAYTGLTILLLQDYDALRQDLQFVRSFTITMLVMMVLVSILYIWFMSNRLTKPIRSLREQIESSKLLDLGRGWNHEGAYDELEALNRSYSGMIKRLSDSIVRENRIAQLNAQANFDALQAQVNPHFLYNTLNIISGRGLMNQDETLCSICDCLAAMLRYTTDTKISKATLLDDLTHLETYIYLLKQRYEHKLEFNAAVDEAIHGQKIPKLLLQRLVENCVNHGFLNHEGVMRIEVRGYVENGWWYVSVRDNGDGFSGEALERLDLEFKTCKEDILHNFKKPESGIGGLGMVNIYASMLLIFKAEFLFRIGNGPDGGAVVLIGAGLQEEENEN